MIAKRTTDEFIRELAERPPVSPALSGGAVLIGMAVASLLPLALFWAVFGLREDLGAAVTRLAVQAKTVLPLAVALLATGLAILSGRPGKAVGLWPLAVPALAGFVLVGLRLAERPDAVVPEVLGQTALACLTSIMALAVLPLWVAIRMFRNAAPTRPAMTGALLGLAAGAGVASGYALHCTEDSPLFYMVWYVLGIVAVAGIGAIAGNRLLRW